MGCLKVNFNCLLKVLIKSWIYLNYQSVRKKCVDAPAVHDIFLWWTALKIFCRNFALSLNLSLYLCFLFFASLKMWHNSQTTKTTQLDSIHKSPISCATQLSLPCVWVQSETCDMCLFKNKKLQEKLKIWNFKKLICPPSMFSSGLLWTYGFNNTNITHNGQSIECH